MHWLGKTRRRARFPSHFQLLPFDGRRRNCIRRRCARYHWGGRTKEDPRAVPALDQLAEELHRTFPADAALRVVRGWTGVIGYTLDGLPAIQRSHSHPGVVQAVGWCGHGVALAIASGAWIAQILCDGAVPEDLPWFRDRPPLLPLELGRWLGFQFSVNGSAWLDRWR